MSEDPGANRRAVGLTRRRVLGLMGGGALALGAAACGGKSPSSGGKGNTVRYWTWMRSDEPNNPRAAAQKKILEAFRKANPDINLIEEVVPWDELENQVRQAARAGRAPDVCRQLDSSVATLARDGSIEPLNDLVAKAGVDKDSFLYPWEDTVIDGEKFAFRQSIRIANLTFYRPDLYKAIGASQPATDINGFVAQAKALTVPPTQGFLIPFGKGDQFNRFMQTVPPLWWAEGSDLIDAKGKPTFHEAAGQRIFQWFQDLVHEHGVMPKSIATMDSETANQMFQGKGLATTWHHSSQWSEWNSLAESGRLGVTRQLALSGRTAPASSEGGWTLCMGKDANREPAWKLIEFFHSKEAELIDGETAGELPTRKETLAEPLFQEERFSRAREWLKYLSEEGHPATTIKIPQRNQFVDALANAAQQIIVAKANVADTLAQAADKYSRAVR